MRVPALQERLFDVGALRLKEMDEAGIDLQVLSHGAPATQRIDADTAVPLARRANDRLHQTVEKNKGRFEAFAVLPTANPRAAADELERTVTKLGFKGGMVHGLTAVDGSLFFLDDKRFWPVFERAQALDVPLYMHPAVPHRAVIEAYYKDYLEQFPGLMTAAWGFTVETATQGIRLVLSGLFEAYPSSRSSSATLASRFPSRCGASTWRSPARATAPPPPRQFPRTLLDHDERQLLHARPFVLRDGRWASTASSSPSTTRSSPTRRA